MSLSGIHGREGTFAKSGSLVQTAAVPENIFVRFDRAGAAVRARGQITIHADKYTAKVTIMKVITARWAPSGARSIGAAAAQSLGGTAASCLMSAHCATSNGGEVGARELRPRGLVSRTPRMKTPLDASEGSAAGGGGRATFPQQPLRPPRRPPPAPSTISDRENAVGV